MHLWHSLHHCPKLVFLILVLRRAKLNGCCRATKMNLCLLSFRALIGMFSSGRARNLKKKIHQEIHQFIFQSCSSNQPQDIIGSISFCRFCRGAMRIWCWSMVSPCWTTSMTPMVRMPNLIRRPPFFWDSRKAGKSQQFTLIASQWHNKATRIFGSHFLVVPRPILVINPSKGPPRVVKLCVQHKSNGYCRFCKVKMVIKNSLPKILI